MGANNFDHLNFNYTWYKTNLTFYCTSQNVLTGGLNADEGFIM